MVVQQGDVVWVVLPHDRFNRTALNTVVVVMLTSQLRYEAQPGNVRLRKGEAGLPKASVVNVTQIATLDRASSASSARPSPPAVRYRNYSNAENVKVSCGAASAPL